MVTGTKTKQQLANDTRKARLEAFVPAKLPVRSVVEGLSDVDRELLEKLIAEPIDFVEAPELHARGAEKTLYGATAKPLGAKSTRFAKPTRVVVPDTEPGAAIPTLTSAQEKLLFLRYNYARMRCKRIIEAHEGKALSAAATRTLLAWHARALHSRSQIVRMNMPLVLAMAKRTRLTSIDFNEIISEGNMALLRSVEKFDCSRGFKFSTYSCRAILKSFSRVAMRASRHRGRFPVEYDPALEQDTFSEQCRVDVEGDCVDELKRILCKNLAELSDVEEQVIRERFALAAPTVDEVNPKTLEQVGHIIGVTKERVRQIQNKALRKIRVALEEHYLAI